MPTAYPAATLDLVTEKKNAHTSGLYGSISSVQFSPDGSKIVSGGIEDKTIKVWKVRPYNAPEWEEVDISEMEKDEEYGDVEIKGLGYVTSNYWRNKVTGNLEEHQPTGGALSLSLGTSKVWDAGACFSVPSPCSALLTCARCLRRSHAGSRDGEAERAQRPDQLGELLA